LLGFRMPADGWCPARQEYEDNSSKHTVQARSRLQD
jgi:hypothetical protein